MSAEYRDDFGAFTHLFFIKKKLLLLYKKLSTLRAQVSIATKSFGLVRRIPAVFIAV